LKKNAGTNIKPARPTKSKKRQDAQAAENVKDAGNVSDVKDSKDRRRETRRDRPSQAATRTLLEHALLGMIAEAPRTTGYDLVKLFELSVSHFWHAHQGQIYPTLDRMEQAGWIASRTVIQESRPNRREFSITPVGQQVLVAWLRSPYEGARIKHAPLVRTRFLGHLPAAEALAYLGEQRQEWSRYLDELKAIDARYFTGAASGTAQVETARGGTLENANRLCEYLTLHYGMSFAEFNMKWCDSATELIKRHRELFSVAASPPARRLRER
jgi:DNA-binding PadR family transcriptional regulator